MLLNRQKRLRIPKTGLEEFIVHLRLELKLGRREVAVCFVDKREIARLNRQFRGKKKPTDVLSFPAGEGKRNGFREGPNSSLLGDIAISPEIASRNAKRFGRSLDSELRVLILHGMLHLLGYDHESDNGTMERKELRLRAKLGLS
jgi:probable rRNA maturation factor